MTEESLLLVKELKEKIRLVFGEFEQLEKRNEELQQVIVSLNNTVEVLEKEKGELTTRYENLKLARVLENGYGDNRLARQKINKMLREIDKCVALLNE
jgi:phage shock protein A